MSAPPAAASRRRRWRRGGGATTWRGVPLGGQLLEVDRVAPQRPLGPIDEPHVARGRSVASAGDGRRTVRAVLGDRRETVAERADHAGGPRRRAAGPGRPSASAISVSTRNGRMNARGWRRWASPEEHARHRVARRTSPRRSAPGSGPWRAGDGARWGRAGTGRRTRGRRATASCQYSGARRRRGGAIRSPVTELYQRSGRSWPRACRGSSARTPAG